MLDKDRSTAGATTRTLARILGPFVTVLAAVGIARGASMGELLKAFESSPVWSWVVGAFVLLIGITVVALHSQWRGPTAIVVSVLGWLIVIRGFMLLAFPNVVTTIATRTLGVQTFWQFVMVLMIIVGVYLSLMGWMPESRSARGAASSVRPPRAA